MQKQIKYLQQENHHLRSKDAVEHAQAPESKGIQVFHCLQSEDHRKHDTSDSDYSDASSTRGTRLPHQTRHTRDNGAYHFPNNPDSLRDGIVYLSEPRWEIQGRSFALSSQLPVVDAKGYMKKRGDISFAVFNYYIAKNQKSAVEAAMKENSPLPEPKPIHQRILLVSRQMVDAVRALFAQFPTLSSGFPEVKRESWLESPFIWWYHCRKNCKGQNHGFWDVPVNATKLVNWIEQNYAAVYNRIDEQFGRGRVSNLSMPYFIHPDDVLVLNEDGMVRGYLATSHSIRQKPFSSRWDIKARCLTYLGGFKYNDRSLSVNLEANENDGEVDISSLDLMPFRHASSEIKEKLLHRGKTFWECRDKKLVAYEGKPSELHMVRDVFRFYRKCPSFIPRDIRISACV